VRSPSRLSRALLAAITVCPGFAVLLLGGPVAAAESPSPSPAPAESGEPDGRPRLELWLDAELPETPTPGATLAIGSILWDADRAAIAPIGTTIFYRTHGAPGDPPIETFARQDWPGHYLGTIEIPEAGLTGLEFGLSGTLCENDVCRRDDWLFPIGGIGPPPGAPVVAIAAATIDVLPEPIVADSPLALIIRVRPNEGIDPALFEMPASLVVRAREPRGPNVAVAEVALAGRESSGLREGVFEGDMTIDEPGEFVLEVATDADGGDATRFGTSLMPIAVEAAATPTNPAATTGSGGLPIVVLLTAAGVAILAGFWLLVQRRSA
jgi:hypothetical protein